MKRNHDGVFFGGVGWGGGGGVHITKQLNQRQTSILHPIFHCLTVVL